MQQRPALFKQHPCILRHGLEATRSCLLVLDDLKPFRASFSRLGEHVDVPLQNSSVPRPVWLVGPMIAREGIASPKHAFLQTSAHGNSQLMNKTHPEHEPGCLRTKDRDDIVWFVGFCLLFSFVSVDDVFSAKLSDGQVILLHWNSCRLYSVHMLSKAASQPAIFHRTRFW